VRLDGALADAGGAGDLLVGQAVGDQGEDLALAVRELGLGGALGLARQQRAGDLGVQRLAAAAARTPRTSSAGSASFSR
jgi:hypothetical protein